MKAKLIWYSESSTGFKNQTLWGTIDYKNVFYLDAQFQNPTYEKFIEEDEDQFGNKVRAFQSVIQKDNLTILAIAPVKSVLEQIFLHDVVELEDLETGKVYPVLNISTTDTTDENSLVGVVRIEVQASASVSGCEHSYTLGAC